MPDFLTNLTWIIIGIPVGLIVIYSIVRLSAIAWHKTKKDYEDDFDYFEHSDYDEEHPERENPKR